MLYEVITPDRQHSARELVHLRHAAARDRALKLVGQRRDGLQGIDQDVLLPLGQGVGA